MSLDITLQLIAAQLDLDAGELQAYAAEDSDIGGYHPDPALQKWPMGSMFAVEGQTLYVLARALKPARTLELGTYYGCSATHLAAAVTANKTGVLHCVDKAFAVPDALRKNKRVKLFEQDALEWLADADLSDVTLAFEDLEHTREQVGVVWKAFMEKLPSGAVIVSHDAEHRYVSPAVRAGIEDALGFLPPTYLTAPSDCGLAIYRKP